MSNGKQKNFAFLAAPPCNLERLGRIELGVQTFIVRAPGSPKGPLNKEITARDGPHG
jgi:hypothetical protein